MSSSHDTFPSQPSAAERVFSLFELFEPIVQDLTIQDLVTATHVSRSFLNNISSSKFLRRRLLTWRNMSLNELVLQDTQCIPTGTVGSRNFDYPHLRIRQPIWLFHTEYEDAVLITYRCQPSPLRPQPQPQPQPDQNNSTTPKGKHEYFLYIPLSPSLPIHALQLCHLTLSHTTYTFTATWNSKIATTTTTTTTTTPFLTKSFDSKLLTYIIRLPRAPHEDPTHMYSYLQSWYASYPSHTSIDWNLWAEHQLKLKPPDGARDERTWLKWSKSMGVGRAKTKVQMQVQRKAQVEVLEVKSSASLCDVEDPTFTPRHGHIRDGSQTDLELNLQNTYISRSGRPAKSMSKASDDLCQTLRDSESENLSR